MMRTSRRSVITQAASLAATSLYARPGAATAETSPTPILASARVRALIESERQSIREAMAHQGIEGVAVCLVHDGAPVWVEGFGVTDTASNRPIGADTIFSIQSTSKNFTAVAVMIAVQRGLLDLDAPITAYLPGFTVQSRFEARAQDRITLRLLLSHRAGFTHEAPVGNNYEPAFPDFEAHVRSLSSTWLRYPVGERYRYSNLGFDLAGYILQVRSGMAFPEWVRTVLFEPIGMNDSTIATNVYAARSNRAIGHEKGHATVPLKTPLIPSGGVYTSARDMAAYAMFHLGRGRVGDKVVLAEDLWREMHGFGLGGDYGFGVIREERRYGDSPVRLLSHKGGGFGFGSVFDYCPETGLAWAALFNRPVDAAYGFGAGLVDSALAQRCGARRPRLAADDLEPIAPPQANLRQLIGTYVGRNAPAKITLEAGALSFQEEKLTTAMRFSAPDETFIVGRDQEIVTYRCYPETPNTPAHLECSVGEDSLDYNDGPRDLAGRNDPRWNRYVGLYRVYQWGVPATDVTVRLGDGYLYLNDTRLIVETEPGLFFTSDGEAVDFRTRSPTWKNLLLRRVSWRRFATDLLQ
jgi:CubicO group peptidase (beta-lactamase class C family)